MTCKVIKHLLVEVLNRIEWLEILVKKVAFLLLKKEMFTDNSAKAEILNDQFSSVFIIDNSEAESIPSLEGPSIYLLFRMKLMVFLVCYNTMILYNFTMIALDFLHSSKSKY